MRTWKLLGGTALCSALVGFAANADVTPEQVWQDWQDMSGAYGQTYKAEAVGREGDTLVVKNLNIHMDEAGTTVDGTLAEIRFREVGDGTVEVTMSESYPITFVTKGTDGAPDKTAEINISMPGLSMIASGSEGDTNYDYTADAMNLDIRGKEGTVQVFDATVAMSDVSGNYSMVMGDEEAKDIETNLLVGMMTMAMNVSDAGTSAKANASVADLDLQMAGNILNPEAMLNMAKAMQDGFAADMTVSYGPADFTIDAVDNGKPTKVATKADEGGFAFDMSLEGMGYSAYGKGAEVTVSGGDIPFPELKLAYSDVEMGFHMPVVKSDDPAPFSFITRMVDLTISDEIWGMLDPTGQLPRDPATLILDASGTVKLTQDILDETAMSSGAAPGELHSLDLSELKVKLAGAELTGSGALTFDNSDVTTFQGVPAPTGKVELGLSGGNGLLDKLIAMGLIPEDQAMGFRMMTAMFAKPGDGPDTLTSTLEFKDKHFFANGQQLQ